MVVGGFVLPWSLHAGDPSGGSGFGHDDEVTDDPLAPATTFAQALDAAIRDADLSVIDLQHRLAARGTPVSAGALRFWRAGERRPEHGRSLDVVDAIEDVLGLDPGSLASRLGPSRRLRRSREEPHDELVGMPGALVPLLEAIGCAELDDLESTGGTLVVDVGADRRVRATSNRMLWRARTHGAQRLRTALALDQPTEHPPTARVVGAEVGRSAYDPVTGWAVWEIVLPRPLAVGESAMIEWSCDDALEDGEVTSYESVAERRVDDGQLWVRFDGDPPRHVERFTDSDAGLVTEVVDPAGSAVHHHVRHFGPGVFGFRWRW